MTRFVPFESAVDAAGGGTAETSAVCRRPAFQPNSQRRITLWEGNVDGEGWRAKRVRHAAALQLCSVCPVLNACRSWLTDIDANRLRVDGVVAGEVREWRSRARKPKK